MVAPSGHTVKARGLRYTCHMPTPASSRPEPFWHVQVAVLATLALQLLLPNRLIPGPRYLLPLVEAVLLLLLLVSTPGEPIFHSLTRRINSLLLCGLISLANVYSLQRLAGELLMGGRISDGHQLILAAVNIYVTNLLIFGLWYWELDGGGHGRRRMLPLADRDFLFPQMTQPDAFPGWAPAFGDYLYVSATNATAFSPTDTLPLTRGVKLLMALQALISLITIALVAARAVNILG